MIDLIAMPSNGNTHQPATKQGTAGASFKGAVQALVTAGASMAATYSAGWTILNLGQKQAFYQSTLLLVVCSRLLAAVQSYGAAHVRLNLE